MKRRGTARLLFLAVIGIAVWGLYWLTPRSRPADGAGAVLVAPEAREDLPPALAPPVPSVRPLTAEPPAPERAEAVSRVSEVVAGSVAGSAVAQLVAELERLDHERPVSFHEDAAPVLQAFASSSAANSAGVDAVAGALEAEFNERAHAPRVAGALLATLGGVGGSARVLALAPLSDPEIERSAMAGLAWNGSGSRTEGLLTLRPTVYLKDQPRGGFAVLDLPWNRAPDELSRSWLYERVRVPAEDSAVLLRRDLAVLALGVAVDLSPDILESFRSWLMDTAPHAQQIRPALVFVLARARSEEAHGVLRTFLEDEQAGDYGKMLARWWLSKEPAMAGDLKQLVAPLLDSTSTAEERTLAAGSLLSRIGGADADTLAQMEELLTLRVLQEKEKTARVAAIAVLEEIPGGFTRLGALEQSLRGDPELGVRKLAARGLARTTGPLRSEALTMLRAALSMQTDPGMKEYISNLLAKADG